jgi:hypothetical protein
VKTFARLKPHIEHGIPEDTHAEWSDESVSKSPGGRFPSSRSGCAAQRLTFLFATR